MAGLAARGPKERPIGCHFGSRRAHADSSPPNRRGGGAVFRPGASRRCQPAVRPARGQAFAAGCHWLCPIGIYTTAPALLAGLTGAVWADNSSMCHYLPWNRVCARYGNLIPNYSPTRLLSGLGGSLGGQRGGCVARRLVAVARCDWLLWRDARSDRAFAPLPPRRRRAVD